MFEKLPGDLIGQPLHSELDFNLALMYWQILQMMALLTPFPYLEMFPYNLLPSPFSGPSLVQTPLKASPFSDLLPCLGSVPHRLNCNC